MEWLFAVLAVAVPQLCLARFYHGDPAVREVTATDDPGEALILTPLIKAGDIERARDLARVGVLEEGVDLESYSGFFTVDERFNSSLFFWYFPAETKNASAPVVLWLQGGPGSSSLFGLFTENGPYAYTEDEKLVRREYSWGKRHNLLYIDNPVDTGFSFTNSSDGLSRNETNVGQNLYSAIVQFFTMFPELQNSDFILSGESYAGKYVPAAAYAIHKNNPTANLTINLKGLAIGNGLCDPAHMMLYSDYYYQLGIIDKKDKVYFRHVEDDIRNKIANKEWKEAAELRLKLLGSHMRNLTGFSYLYNYLYNTEPVRGGNYSQFVQSEAVRRALHVGGARYHTGLNVSESLMNDIMQSIVPWLVELLSAGYRVLVYSGQLDLRIPYPTTVAFLRAMEWGGAAEYLAAPRRQWHVGSELAGYVKTAGNLTELLVRNSGHMVPADQPKWAFDLISKFADDKPFH
ncbi:venom serine carboxypeptidase-like [Bacillus rossius redtenbacheri]|uniref:venom serine carboxypeptidase-like n=1 Tax=Bacillus rossius redtenbacheri TaxID=93214 RepID=UPI002FDE9F27